MELQPQYKIRTCPHCGQDMPIKNIWHELWRWPTLNEWITLFMIVMMVFVAWAYKHDMAACQNYIKNIDAICAQKGHTIINLNPYSNSSVQNLSIQNVTGIIIINQSDLNLTK